MDQRVVWWGQYVVLLLIVVLGALSPFAYEPVLLRGALITALSLLLLALSPTRVLFGTRRIGYDVPIVLGALLLSGYAAAPPVATYLLTAGLVLLLGVAAVPPTPRAPSVLAIFGQRGRVATMLMALLCLLGFTVMLVEPLLRWTDALATVPPIAAVLAFAALLLLLQRHGFLASERIMRADAQVRRAGEAMLRLFTGARTILLGVSGLLIVQYVADRSVALALETSLEWRLVAGFFGWVLLIAIPVVIWRSVFLIRTTGSHEHLPDWYAAAIGAALALISLAVLPASMAAGVAAGIAAGVFTLCVVIGRAGDYPRRVLMAGPFLAGVLMLGMYAYDRFVESFAGSAQWVLAALQVQAYGAALALLVLFAMTVIFSIAGYLSFLYEIWRD